VETETIREYDITDASNTRYAETVINYSYESSHHKMLTSKTTTDSRGSEVLTQYRYPPDFDATAGSNGSMGKLTDLHTISPVIEQLTWKDNKLIGGVITDYDKFTTNSVDYVLPKSVYVTQVALPVSGLDPDDVLNTDPASPVNPFINQLTNNIYDNDRLLQYTRENDLTVSYIWGYKNTRPIAEVKNAQANEILHASFEEEINTENFSTDSRTGKKSLKIAYAVSLPSPGTYRLTYWKKNTGSDWELVQEVISANTTIGGSAMVIDEVRLYPVEAQMTTYTYDRLMGVTSITDQANSTLNYEYDGLGRLQNIRDMDGNIVKNYFYHYGIK
jgi:YD repeat-containing protein